MYRTCYTTLQQLKAQKKIEGTAGDLIMQDKIHVASRMIDRLTQRVFYAYDATLRAEVDDVQLLLLPDDLLALTTSELADGSYELMPLNTYPKTQVVSNGIGDDYVSFTGTWGYHTAPAVMWTSIGALAGDINASIATVTLGASASIGYPNLIKIDNEYMTVTNESGADLTVERGANGSTAEAHTAGATVYRFVFDDRVVQACLTLALYLYETRDNFGETITGPGGTLTISKNLPATFHSAIAGLYRYADEWGTP